MDIAQKTTQVGRLKLPHLSLGVKKTIIGYIFIAPFILGFFIWFLGPTVYSAYLSLTEWNIPLSAVKNSVKR